MSISNEPFENRCPPPRRRRPERLTRADRFVLALFGGLLGMVSWILLYAIIAMAAFKAEAKLAARAQPEDPAATNAPIDRIPAYWWGFCPALAFAGYGSIVGAERMMDGFDRVLRGLGELARAAGRQD